MNTLSNGAIAVGSPGSLMRFQTAYEYELTKAVEANPEKYRYTVEEVPSMAIKIVESLAKGNAFISPAIKAAAKACEIKPTALAIRQYLQDALKIL
jgi:hypothetical protein